MANIVPMKNEYRFKAFQPEHTLWLNLLNQTYPHAIKSGVIEAEEINTLSHIFGKENKNGKEEVPVFLLKSQYRVGRGKYNLPDIKSIQAMFLGGDLPDDDTPDVTEKISNMPKKISLSTHKESVAISHEVCNVQRQYIPKLMDSYQSTPNGKWIERIIESGRFMPIYLYGETGTGKTTEVIQSCAKLGRGLFRVNITADTDESDILGSMALKSKEDGGGTFFDYGPAVLAMQTGSVLLLDEIDLGTPRIMCLQPILEGNPIYLKKTKETIYPKPGFNVIATGNTKGRGSSGGQYVGTQQLNDAFMDRFPLWMEIKYPTPALERNILTAYWKDISPYDVPEEFITALQSWAVDIRDAHESDAVDSTISTRRLKSILDQVNLFFEKSYKDNMEAIISRFDADTFSAFMKYWKLKYSDLSRRSLQIDIQSGSLKENKPKKGTKTKNSSSDGSSGSTWKSQFI